MIPLPRSVILIAAFAVSATGIGAAVVREPAKTDGIEASVLGRTLEKSGNKGGNKGSGGDKPQNKDFTIEGSIVDLFPGSDGALELTIANPNNFTITVTSLGVAVGDASAACPAAHLQLTPWAGELTVAANGTATTQVPAALATGTPTSCAGASWPLTFTGKAVKP